MLVVYFQFLMYYICVWGSWHHIYVHVISNLALSVAGKVLYGCKCLQLTRELNICKVAVGVVLWHIWKPVLSRLKSCRVVIC